MQFHLQIITIMLLSLTPSFQQAGVSLTSSFLFLCKSVVSEASVLCWPSTSWPRSSLSVKSCFCVQSSETGTLASQNFTLPQVSWSLKLKCGISEPLAASKGIGKITMQTSLVETKQDMSISSNKVLMF